MKTMNNEELFDCLENKWKVSEMIYEETKELSDNELIIYFQKAINDSSLSNWWENVKQKEEVLI